MIINLTHDNGTTPVIPMDAARTELQIQNTTDDTIEYNRFGPVSLTDPAKRGLLLAPGGTTTLLGVSAQRAFYAIHGHGAGTTRAIRAIMDR